MGEGRRYRPVAIGPSVPLVKAKDFTQLLPQAAEDAWIITGPTVQRNLDRGVPLYKIFAVCYLEGLQHGLSLPKEASDGSDSHE